MDRLINVGLHLTMEKPGEICLARVSEASGNYECGWSLPFVAHCLACSACRDLPETILERMKDSLEVARKQVQAQNQ